MNARKWYQQIIQESTNLMNGKQKENINYNQEVKTEIKVKKRMRLKMKWKKRIQKICKMPWKITSDTTIMWGI